MNLNKIFSSFQSVIYTCPICFKEIRSKKSNFDRHVRLHQAAELETRLKCVLCKKTYQNQTNFNAHVIKYHKTHDGPVAYIATGEGARKMPTWRVNSSDKQEILGA